MTMMATLIFYVANYVDLDLEHLPEFGKGPFASIAGFPVFLRPTRMKGGRDVCITTMETALSLR